jgi:hypothetical protein
MLKCTSTHHQKHHRNGDNDIQAQIPEETRGGEIGLNGVRRREGDERYEAGCSGESWVKLEWGGGEGRVPTKTQ